MKTKRTPYTVEPLYLHERGAILYMPEYLGYLIKIKGKFYMIPDDNKIDHPTGDTFDVKKRDGFIEPVPKKTPTFFQWMKGKR